MLLFFLSLSSNQILIYENYVNILLKIIYELIIQLDCKGIDREVVALNYSEDKSVKQTSATTGSGLKKENPEDTAIVAAAAMDLTE